MNNVTTGTLTRQRVGLPIWPQSGTRVSTRDQDPDAQHDGLAAAGCEKVFTDHAYGALARRTGLDEALGYLRSGESLVVTKLDRLGQSVRHLQQIVDDLQGRDVGLRALPPGLRVHGVAVGRALRRHLVGRVRRDAQPTVTE